MPLLARFLVAAAPLLFLATEEKAGGGAAKLSIADQLTGAQARVIELEGLQAAWNGERTSLSSERDTLKGQVTTLQGQLDAAAGEQSKLAARVKEVEGQLATANGQIGTLTKERDAANALAANPSTQARTILAAAGGASVPMQAAGAGHPGEAGKVAVATPPGGGNLKSAIAKMAAKAAEKK